MCCIFCRFSSIENLLTENIDGINAETALNQNGASIKVSVLYLQLNKIKVPFIGDKLNNYTTSQIFFILDSVV